MAKQLVLIRGCQGSGKSTTASVWAAGVESRWYEADAYFTDINGIYDFNRDYLVDAHKWCLMKTKMALSNEEVERVVVSNTFSTLWEMRPYIDSAKEAGAALRVICIYGEHGSIHRVPKDVIDSVKARFEPYVGEYLCCSSRSDITKLVEAYPKYKGCSVREKAGCAANAATTAER